MFLQENGFVSQGIGRKHMVMREVEENSSLWIKCSFLTLVFLSGEGKGGERLWKNESPAVGGFGQTPEEECDPRSPVSLLKTTLMLHFKVWLPKCSKPASNPEGFTLNLILIPLRSIQNSRSCSKLGLLQSWDFGASVRVLTGEQWRCFGTGGNAQKFNQCHKKK